MGGKSSYEYGFLYIQTSIDSSYTGGFVISGSNENKVVASGTMNDMEGYKTFQLPYSGSSIYTMYASSSNASSNFKIYNVVFEFR